MADEMSQNGNFWGFWVNFFQFGPIGKKISPQISKLIFLFKTDLDSLKSIRSGLKTYNLRMTI